MRTIDPEGVTPAGVTPHLLVKQHLAPGSAGADVVSLAGDLIGLHATSSLSPYLSAFARLTSFRPEDLDRELYERRSLLRLKCMRGTVFVVPRDLAPVLFAATRAATLSGDRRWLRVARDHYEQWAPRVLDALAGTALGAAELRRLLGADDRLPAVVSMLCDEALILRDRPTGTRRSSAFRYRRWDDVYPDLDLSAIPEATAIELLVHRYVAAYGPVTLRDVAWWSALPLGRVRPAVEGLVEAQVVVRLPGAANDLLMSADDLARADAAPAGAGSVVLLPVLDPYLMGYRDRDRFLDPSLRPLVYDRGGNATATVLVDGRVEGVWDLTETPRAAVRVLLFDPAQPLRSAVLDRCAAVGEFWFRCAGAGAGAHCDGRARRRAHRRAPPRRRRAPLTPRQWTVPVTRASRPVSSSRSTGRRVTPAATWWKPALTCSTGTPMSRDQPSR